MADEQLLTLTAEIVAAHLANNKVATGDVAGLVRATYEALAQAGAPEPQPEQQAEEHAPATTVRKSLASRDRIISMIDGKPYTSLKRHLSRHGLTPAEYRERYGLKPDYPMVAPGYSEKRRALSLELGLGRKKKPAPESITTDEPTKPAKRGRANKLSGSEAPAKVRRPKQQQAEPPIADEPRINTPEVMGEQQA